MFMHRRPSLKAREAMAEAAMKLGEGAESAEEHHQVKEAEKVLSEALGRRVRLMASGDSAILAAVKIAGRRILIPDQGGWKSFRTIPEILGKKVVELETELGIIEPEKLEDAIHKFQPSAFLFTSSAGYMAEQPVEEIVRICREEGVLTIEDISGAFGDRFSGRADIVVCSTGAPKILNLTSGGFIGGKELDGAMEIIRASRISPVMASGLIEEIKFARHVIDRLYRGVVVIKEEIPEALFQESRGIAVGILCNNPKKVAYRARAQGMVTDIGRSLITTCPRYERFNDRGIVVELKKVDVLDLGDEDFKAMADMVGRALSPEIV
ncbi:hypothetical protein BMS3Bbin15_00834 [archaeon BMS3Bbin15]|nr:hypothetical protein BMS3Bbin15_00834 [archaeon BMS3Bbin15]